MTDRKNPPKTLEEIVEKLLQDVVDALGSLAGPRPVLVPVPVRKGPRR